ncbi:hypothetical protein L873DRAFT_1787437 [Choiromyces venosus 120613-1]|uniref:Uncharacterized protein n=1 Tax=Choiromyces venosus 120613-1 TaxID=1336337 RepID=A0A3N4K2Q1_9PEZI|nr:hypothetical protein L873DRAFT_1787437 [Choiromyces venosus 120613-1]
MFRLVPRKSFNSNWVAQRHNTDDDFHHNDSYYNSNNGGAGSESDSPSFITWKDISQLYKVCSGTSIQLNHLESGQKEMKGEIKDLISKMEEKFDKMDMKFDKTDGLQEVSGYSMVGDLLSEPNIQAKNAIPTLDSLLDPASSVR